MLWIKLLNFNVVEIVMLPTYRVVALVVDIFMDKSLEPKQNTSNHLSSKTGNLDTCEKMNPPPPDVAM